MTRLAAILASAVMDHWSFPIWLALAFVLGASLA